MDRQEKSSARSCTYSTDSCPSCVRNAINEELKAMGRVETEAEADEIRRWEGRHRYLKIAAFVVFMALIYVLYTLRPM